MKFKAKRLIVMDVDVFLCHHSDTSDYTNNSRSFMIENIRVVSRPYLHQFMNFCFKYFDVAVWSTKPVGTLFKYLKLLFSDEERRSLKFSFGKEKMHCLGIENKEEVYVKKIETILIRMPHRIREYVTLLDSPINTYCVPFLSSLYPSTYDGNEDDTFLRDDLVPFLSRLYMSDYSSCKYIEKHYPTWSQESLILDWEKNKERWRSSRFIEERGDTDHRNKFREYQLKCRSR